MSLFPLYMEDWREQAANPGLLPVDCLLLAPKNLQPKLLKA